MWQKLRPLMLTYNAIEVISRPSLSLVVVKIAPFMRPDDQSIQKSR